MPLVIALTEISAAQTYQKTLPKHEVSYNH